MISISETGARRVSLRRDLDGVLGPGGLRLGLGRELAVLQGADVVTGVVVGV